MSTVPTTQRSNGVVAPDDPLGWRSQTRVFLQPLAAPSILGLFGFAGATFMVAANMANWYGDAGSGVYIFPFAAMFGGVAQFAAGMWAYRARDGIATAMHGMWGSFWLGYGVLWLLRATGDITLPAGTFDAFGFWFLVLAAITACGAIAAAFENLSLFSVLATLAVGSAFAAVFFLTGAEGWKVAAGWVLLASSWLAAYTAFADDAGGRRRARAAAARPSQQALEHPRTSRARAAAVRARRARRATRAVTRAALERRGVGQPARGVSSAGPWSSDGPWSSRG